MATRARRVEGSPIEDLAANFRNLQRSRDASSRERSASSSSDPEVHKDRMREYSQMMKEEYREGAPEVEYPAQQGCCCRSRCMNVCRRICSRINIACCGATIYVRSDQISSNAEGNVQLIARAQILSPPREENRLTNAGFYLELYNKYGDMLENIFPIALQFLPLEEQEFWDKWDPDSEKPLTLKSTRALKAFLAEANEALKKIRIEMMAEQMKNFYRRSPVNSRSPLETASLVEHTPRNRRQSSTTEHDGLPKAHMMEPLDQQRVVKTASVEDFHEMGIKTPKESFQLDRSDSYTRAMRRGTRTAIKHINVIMEDQEKAETENVEFDRSRIFADIKRIGNVTNTEANEVADEVLRRLPSTYTRQVVWDTLMAVALEEEIGIKDAVDKEVKGVLTSQKYGSKIAGADRAIDLDTETLAEIMREIKAAEDTAARRDAGPVQRGGWRTIARVATTRLEGDRQVGHDEASV